MKHLVLIGGSGQHVGLAFLRLLNLFNIYLDPKNFIIWLIDADKTGESYSRLINQIQQQNIPEMDAINPFPDQWGSKTFSAVIAGQRCSQLEKDLFHLEFGDKYDNILINEGAHGCPPVGASIMKVALHGNNNANYLKFIELLRQGGDDSIVMMVGSSFGGTGAGGLPNLGEDLFDRLHDKIKLNLNSCILDNLFSLPQKPELDLDTRTVSLSGDRLKANSSSTLAFNADQKLQTIFRTTIIIGHPNDPGLRANIGFRLQPEHISFLYPMAAMLISKVLFDENNPLDDGLHVYNLPESLTTRTYTLYSPNTKHFLIPTLQLNFLISHLLYRLAEYVIYPPNDFYAPFTISVTPPKLSDAIERVCATHKYGDREHTLKALGLLLASEFNTIDAHLKWLVDCYAEKYFPISNAILQPEDKILVGFMDNPMPLYRRCFNDNFNFNPAAENLMGNLAFSIKAAIGDYLTSGKFKLVTKEVIS
jgi:hypothetical protein